MSIIQRFTAVDKAILVATGNSLVVCGSSSAIEDNTSELIKIDGTTTRDWNQCGSMASINILENSTILYAELVWYSTVFSNVSGALDLRSIQDSEITFETSKGSYQIAPKYTDSYTSPSGSIDRYRAADVTSYVQAAMSGNYTISKVPISIPNTGLSNSRGGWTLTIIYRNNTFAPQKILYNSGISVATPSTPLQTALAGFTTSSDTENLKGYVFLSAANGEPLNGNEYVSAGPSFAELTNIGNIINSPNPNPGKSPNNPGNSFFSGVINVADVLSSTNGLLNITGTNGINNNDGFVPTQKVGARNKWDITNVNISNTLVANQTLLAGQIVEGALGDGVQLVAVGAQVSAKAPNIIATLDAYDIDGDDEYNVEVNEPQVYAIHIRNDGDVDATNVIVSAVLNSVTTFIPGSVVINEVSTPASNIINGINLGTIEARGVVNVLFTVRVNSVPSGGLLYQNINYNYQFISGIDTITNYATTNTVELIVQEGKLNIAKASSATTINVGESVTYTIDISNIGTELATNLFFQDIIDTSSSFVDGTVIIDDIPHGEYNPIDGFSLPNLAVGNSTKIVFQARINSIPPSTKVNNVSHITYGYVFNQYGFSRMKTLSSNITNIQVQYIDIIGERVNNNNYPKVGDTVTYTLSLTNMGNIPSNTVEILEPQIPGASFITGTVKINGTLSPDSNPFVGFDLPSPIEAKATTNVEYKVLIDSLNPESLIENIAKVPFKYQITTGSEIITTEKDSNKVDTVANFVCMTVTKKVDKAYATINDILYYSFDISNNGNINATDTIFLDTLQSNVSFVTGSVTINGISYPNYNPNAGFTIGNVGPDDIIEVNFQAKVLTVPNPNIVYNTGSLVYSYQPDPTGGKLTNTIFSNTVQTIINKAAYTIVKSVDKTYAKVGDNLIYTIVINNTGTVPLTNMKFADFLGVFLEFKAGTVNIDGVHYPELNPSNQFPIVNMQPGETATISFAAKIVGNTPVGYIPNISEVTLTYKENPDSPVITKTVMSNVVKTYDPIAVVSLTKSVDNLYAKIGDTLTYSFTTSNSGNAKALNPFFADTIQSNVSFVVGSVFVNGVNKPDYDPGVGFNLNNIEIGQVVTIEFKVTVNTLPTPNTVKNNGTISYSYYIDPNNPPISNTVTSNTVTTIVNAYSATLTKLVNKYYATVGEDLEYTITATNTGTVTLTEVNFIDLVPTGATFTAGSVKVNGVSKPSFNPDDGFVIDNILPGSSSVVIFKVAVTSVPTPPQLKNNSTINFKYQLTPTSPYINTSLTSNTVTTNINAMAVTNTKSVSKLYATMPDTFTYTSVISNNGNVSIENTQFIDNVPSNLTFVTGSVKINDIAYPAYNPNTGFTVGALLPLNQVTVTFDVTVDSIPASGYVTNISTINYQYKIDPNLPYINGTVSSNTVTTYINLGNLTVSKTPDRTIVRLTNTITYNFVITNTGNTLLQNLLFKDILQAESSFKTGTVYVNGVNRSTFNPVTGFTISNIAVGQQATVSFQVTANSVPPENKLLNSADVTYSYYVNPSENLVTKTKTSNITTVEVYDSIVSANKAVDKSTAKIGDTLLFTITIKNDGNVAVENGFFTDTLDSHISFVNDSVYINGVQKLGFDPNNGFSLDNISPAATTTVAFTATVMSRPTNNIIYNFATINYDYTVGADIINATINTNTTQTYVATSEITVTKEVDKVYATIDDNLAYTITVSNTGSVNATSISLQDLVPASATFNSGTVVVDGVSQPTFNPVTGFALTDLIPGRLHSITFSVKVNSLPQSSQIDNKADITYTYKLTATDTPVTTTTHSNTVTTYIKVANISALKTVDKMYATIGDNLNYTVKIDNLGNATCLDLFFQDIVQSNATFVNGSVMINGTNYPSYSPNTGFTLPDLVGYASITVKFDVTVVSLPTDYTIYNYATGSFKYYVDPTKEPIVAEGFTNTVTTIINVGKLTATKEVSKANATIGDNITYTVYISNIGNVISKNVNFRDVVPIGLTFITGSVTINGTAHPSYDPYASFSLGNINPGDTVIVKFDVTVTTVPTPSLASNTANITYSYRVDPNGSDIPVILNSNTVTTQINVGSLTLTKSVNVLFCTKGDIVTYTVVVNNNGNVAANNVIFVDNLQSDVTFKEGSVKVNGTSQPLYDPTLGFNLGTIAPLGTINVEFSVTVIQTPTQNVIVNFALGTFDYKVDPNGQYFTKTAQSNNVYTMLIIPALTATKTVDKLYATLLDILNYNILVKNTGNTTLSEMMFTDLLSNGAIFKPGTVIIDDVNYPTYDPILGFKLPSDLISGITSLIKFQATVNTLPSPPIVTNYALQSAEYHIDPEGPIYPISTTSNTVTTNIKVGSLSNTKSVDKLYAKVNDTVTYTSTITNTGNVTASNLVFTDILQVDLMYVTGTVKINDVVYPSLNPTIGFALPDLGAGQTVTVAFTAKITALPTPSYVTNTSNVNFSYKIDPIGSYITKDQTSNQVTTNVILGKITAVKTVDKPIATINDELTYTITLTNIGNVIGENVLFQDIPSAGVTFKTGSVKIDNTPMPTYDPTIGFSLNSIGIGNVVTVQFVVTVVSVPQTNEVTNQAVITFDYVVDPKQPAVTQTTYSNTVTTHIAYGSLSVTKNVNKAYATIGEEITYTIAIVNTGNINATDVVFVDPTPHNTNFVIGSVTINGVSYPNYNPSAGFNLNVMTPGQIVTIVYKVKVIELC